jgi:hypothetical protein
MIRSMASSSALRNPIPRGTPLVPSCLVGVADSKPLPAPEPLRRCDLKERNVLMFARVRTLPIALLALALYAVPAVAAADNDF